MIRQEKKKLMIWITIVSVGIILAGLTAYLYKVTNNNKLGAVHNDNIHTINDTVMGTVVTAKIYHDKDITNDIMNMLEDLENKYLSWRVKTSDIAQINFYAGAKKGYSPNQKTMKYFENAYEFAKSSEGAFDFTLGKISQLWNLESDNPYIPKTNEVEELLKDTGYEKVEIYDNTVSIPENMSIDFGAMGKGIACDEIFEILSNKNVSAGTISVGGSSILTYGNKPDGSPWKVAITNPRNEDGVSYLGTLSLEGTKQISTSGDYEKYVMYEGKRYHHILDPDTGYPAESGLISVTIVSDKGWLSDGLSTACFVLGYEKSQKLLKKYNAEAVFVDSNSQVYVTEGLKDSFTLTDTSYVVKE